MLLVNHILTHVLFIFNFRYYDNHILVCGTCWIKNIRFFSFVFAAPPVISRRSHTLRRRAVGQIFPHGQELWSQGGKFDSLWTSVVGEELLPGRTWLQSEWMSTSQVLEFAAGTAEKYLYTTWFVIPLGGFQLNNTSAIQKYLKIPISNYFKCFLLPIAKMAVKYNNSFCKGSWSTNQA